MRRHTYPKRAITADSDAFGRQSWDTAREVADWAQNVHNEQQMPSAAPNLTDDAVQQLQALASQLRKCREQLGVSATAVAASANLSRVTLHRIERGNPSVTIGAWLNVAQALGTQIKLTTNPVKPQAKPENADTNRRASVD